MFNNPLDSFHNTVAEAKAEREQLDRLLTISTPREHLLLGLVVLLLVALTCWLVFGTFERSVAVSGTVIEYVPNPDLEHQIVRVDVWLDRSIGAMVKAGLPIAIRHTKSQVGKEVITGAISSIQTLTLSEEFIIAGQAPLTAQRFEIVVNPEVDVSPYVGNECSVIVKLGKQSPFAFLGEKLL